MSEAGVGGGGGRSLPSSELQLTRAQIRAQIRCPRCGAEPWQRCTWKSGRVREYNHQARRNAARAQLRARRLGGGLG